MTDFLEKINFFCYRKCIIFKDKTYNYIELYNKVLEIKNNVLDKIEQGRIVAILSDYSFESIALLLALYENKIKPDFLLDIKLSINSCFLSIYSLLWIRKLLSIILTV